MTSLAQQLQRLAVPHTQTVLAADKRRASLLFDPKEAANLDRETIFALGVNGLEDLENVNGKFVKFEASLFNKSSQTWERSQQTKDVNEQLDETIKEFLIQLSPYFLLKSAHKTLEWLIYRYHIHQYNVDDLLMCIFPYHQTKIFVRCLQLLKLDKPTDKWHWLHACATEGVPLAQATLTNHCKKDPGFLSFICDFVPQFIKVHGKESSELRTVVSFFTVTLLGALQHKADITERVVSIAIPNLVRGLRSKVKDYQAGAYMVLAQLVTQVTLKDDTVTTVIGAVTKKMSPSLAKEALSILFLIYRTQTVQELHKRSFKHLCRLPELIPLLAALSQEYTTSPLLGPFCRRLLPAALEHGDGPSYSSSEESDDELSEARPSYRRLWLRLLSEVQLSQGLADAVTRDLLEQLVSYRQSKVKTEVQMEGWQNTARELLGVMERRYPESLDAAMESTLAKYAQDKAHLDILQELTSLTPGISRHQLLSEAPETSLLLGLHHPQAGVRVMAVKQLARGLGNTEGPGAEFGEDAILERLRDDSPDVVQEVLSIPTLPSYVDKEKLVTALLSLLHTRQGKKHWRDTLTQALKVICGKAFSAMFSKSILPSLLPMLLITGKKDLKSGFAKTILGSELAKQEAILKGFTKDWLRMEESSNEEGLSDEGVAALSHCLLTGLCGAVHKLQPEARDALLSALQTQTTPHARFLQVCLLASYLNQQQGAGEESEVRDNCALVDRLLAVVTSEDKQEGTGKEGSLEDAASVSTWLSELQAHKALPVGVCVWAIRCATRYLCAQELDASQLWIDGSEPLACSSLQLLAFLVQCSCAKGTRQVWGTLVLDFMQTYARGSLYKLLAYIWMLDARTAEEPQDLGVNPVVQVECFYFAKKLWESESEDNRSTVTDYTVAISLLCSLYSPSESVRQAALQALSTLRELDSPLVVGHTSKIKRLLKRQEEIRADNAQAAVVLGVIIAHQAKRESSPARRRSSSDKTDTMDSLRQLLRCSLNSITPLPVKLRLLEVLKEVPHEMVLEEMCTVGNTMLDDLSSTTITPTNCYYGNQILRLIAARLDEVTLATVNKDSAAFTLLLRGIAADIEKEGLDSPQATFLAQVTKESFRALPSLDLQQCLVSKVMEAGVKATKPETAAFVREALKRMKLNGEHVSHVLRPSDAEGVGTVKGRKRARTKKETAPLDYKGLNLLLEVMQGRKKVTDSETLAAILFSLLSRLGVEEQSDMEYTRQLALTCLHNLCTKWTPEDAPKQDVLTVEALVQCIRESSSPQTQKQALMVMAAVAPLYPEYILHHVMSVFTFVGTSLVQHDDKYSLQLIWRTIDTIIPAVIQAHQTKDPAELHALITDILRVFVDARHHIPRHRSQRLYHHLVECVGVEAHLWVVGVLMMESAVRGKDVPTSESAGHGEEGVLEQEQEAAVGLLSDFTAGQQLQALTRTLTFLQALTTAHDAGEENPRSKLTKKTSRPSVPVVQLSTLSAQQCRLLQYHCTKLVVAVLSRSQFTQQILSQSDKGEDSVTTEQFKDFMQECLSYLNAVAKGYGTHSNTGVGKFWRALQNKVYEILDKVTELVPSSVLLACVCGLLPHPSPALRRKALDLLNKKLHQLAAASATLTPVQEESLLALLDTLLPLVKASKGTVTEAGDTTEVTHIRQMALYSLKLLCKLLGSQHRETFTQLFPVSIKLLKSSSAPPQVRASALLCVAELCSSVQAHAIPHLSAFMPPLLSLLNNHTLLAQQEQLQVCALTTLHRVLTSLPHFISPYLFDTLCVTCDLSCTITESEDPKKSQSALRLRAIRHQLSAALPARVLVPALSETYSRLLTDNQPGIRCLMSVVQEHIQSMGKEDLSAHHTQLLALFCSALDLRNAELKLSDDGLEQTEGVVQEAVLAMVVRLTENAFRPMFYKLYDWACREDTKNHRCRQLVFFSLCHRLAERLKSLFNFFVGHTLQMAGQLIIANNTMKQEVDFYGPASDPRSQELSQQLLVHILGCVRTCLLHDADSAVSKDMYTALMQPLVDQLENTLEGKLDYKTWTTEHVIPCVSQLAAASRDDASWRALNYQVCLKTRHTSPKVRYASLSALESLAAKLGEEYMILLPETIPFLAELMEDDSEEVEQQCQHVVSSLEELLGESLHKYF